MSPKWHHFTDCCVHLNLNQHQPFTLFTETMANNSNNNNNNDSDFIVLNLRSEGEEQVKNIFKQNISKLLDSSSVLIQSAFFVYVKMVCYLFEKNKSFQDFVDLLAESLDAHVESYKAALYGVRKRSTIVATYKRQCFESCLATGKQVLSFFEKVVSKNYKEDPTYIFLQYSYSTQVEALENVLESFVCPTKTLASNRSYFRFKIDYRLGLRSQPQEVFDLISADVPSTLIGPTETDLESKLLDYYKSEPLIPQKKIDAFVELKTEYIYGVEVDASTGVSPRRSSRIVTTPSKSATPNKTATSKKRKSSQSSQPKVHIEDSSEDELDNDDRALSRRGASVGAKCDTESVADDKDAKCDLGAENDDKDAQCDAESAADDKDAQCDVGADNDDKDAKCDVGADNDDKDAQCDTESVAYNLNSNSLQTAESVAQNFNSNSNQTADTGKPIVGVVEVSDRAKQFTEYTKIQMAEVLLSTEDWLHFGTEIYKVIHAQEKNSISTLLELFRKIDVVEKNDSIEDEKEGDKMVCSDNLSEGGAGCDDKFEGVKEGDKMGCTDNLSEGGEECELEPYPLNEVLTKINLSVCSWTRPENDQIKGLECFSQSSNPKLFGIFVRAFSLFIFPSKFPHPRVSTVKKLLLDLSRNQNAATRIMPELDALHYRLGSIEFPSTKEAFLVLIRSKIQSSIHSGSLKFTAADAAPTASLYRLGDSVLFSILVQKPAGMRTIPNFTIPLSFPVPIQGKTLVLQTVAANFERNKNYMRSTICRGTLNCGGYFLTTQVDGEKHKVIPLIPGTSQSPIKSIAKSGAFSYDLEELFFVETYTQSFAKESSMLDEEYVFECPSLAFVKGEDLRQLQLNEYMECNILEAVVELLKQRVKRVPLLETRKVRNIIFPAQFWSTLTQVETLEALHQCNSAFHLSQYVWDTDSIVHLIMFYPASHWQYCTLVFAQKKVYFNDSYMASAETEGRNKQIRKLLGFVQEYSGFVIGVWEFIDCIVPQQTEKRLHFCGTYVTINLLRAYVEGLSENPFEEVPSWSLTSKKECTTIPIPILNAAKQLIADAILGRRDIFDLFYLLLPSQSLSQERSNRGRSLCPNLKWIGFKRNESEEYSLNLTSVRDLTFFELT
jgi:hypothetical protein